MGQHHSKDEVLYQFVHQRDITAIRHACRNGAGLEWIDKEGKTPLIVACLAPDLFCIAKLLIELGANLNYYRPGRHGGTPLHHAAKKGLQSSVELLLVHGANPLVINDDCQTPLEVARAKGHASVVRAIENHICLFSGWLREFHGPTFLELLAPQFVLRKVWVVVVPCGGRNPAKPFKLELAIYSNFQDAEPRLIIELWKAHLEESNFGRRDPFVTITDNSSKTRVKLALAMENDIHLLQLFSSACRGIPQQQQQEEGAPPAAAAAVLLASAPESGQEDVDLAMAITASLRREPSTPPGKLTADEGGPSEDPARKFGQVPALASAPPVDDDGGPICYPSIDDDGAATEVQSTEGGTCVVCLDSRVEGVCVPCGHMAGCMSCLTEVKSKEWGCPVCRSHIQQVVRLYAV